VTGIGPISIGNVMLHRSSVLENHVYLEARDGRIEVGEGTVLRRFVHAYSYGGCISIGDGAVVNVFAVMYSYEGGDVTIGENAIVAPHVLIVPADHRFDRPGDVKGQGHVARSITIGKGSWIGGNSAILNGGSVGVGCVIGAGSIVNSPIPDNAIAVGAPARVIGRRRG
jgi:acetyltransferase-like isoleucine patch superfamily enzyme